MDVVLDHGLPVVRTEISMVRAGAEGMRMGLVIGCLTASGVLICGVGYAEGSVVSFMPHHLTLVPLSSSAIRRMGYIENGCFSAWIRAQQSSAFTAYVQRLRLCRSRE